MLAEAGPGGLYGADGGLYGVAVRGAGARGAGGWRVERVASHPRGRAGDGGRLRAEHGGPRAAGAAEGAAPVTFVGTFDSRALYRADHSPGVAE